ncbi:hypothetical protein DM80_4714 [Burkholderia multivorans]|nr:hypothetical protein DM80_4714 [Burkholderia multivorans]
MLASTPTCAACSRPVRRTRAQPSRPPRRTSASPSRTVPRASASRSRPRARRRSRRVRRHRHARPTADVHRMQSARTPQAHSMLDVRRAERTHFSAEPYREHPRHEAGRERDDGRDACVDIDMRNRRPKCTACSRPARRTRTHCSTAAAPNVRISQPNRTASIRIAKPAASATMVATRASTPTCATDGRRSRHAVVPHAARALNARHPPRRTSASPSRTVPRASASRSRPRARRRSRCVRRYRHAEARRTAHP